MKITFCGHSRFFALKEYKQIILDFLLEKIGDTPADMYLGGYGDFDNLAYSCCKKYKETHKNVSLIFISPYMTEEYQKNHLEHIKTIYDEIIYPEIENKPLKFAISYRNKWMVEKVDLVICGINHYTGGAYKTYLYAKRKKKEIFNVADFTKLI